MVNESKSESERERMGERDIDFNVHSSAESERRVHCVTSTWYTSLDIMCDIDLQLCDIWRVFHVELEHT